jgi:hypothetical protein
MASKKAVGNIIGARFVKMDAADGTILQSGAGEEIFGVSNPGSRLLPLSGWDDGLVAISGENVHVYCLPEDRDCFLECNGTVAPGDKLKSGALGIGVVTTTPQDIIGAIVEENATANQLPRVRLLPPGTRL